MGLFGYGRVVLGDWPQIGLVKAAIAEIESAGGTKIDAYGVPGSDWECIRFRIHGRRVKLSFEELGEVTLWGPRNLVLDLSQRVSAKLPASKPNAALSHRDG
jgi:hypothetical protein